MKMLIVRSQHYDHVELLLFRGAKIVEYCCDTTHFAAQKCADALKITHWSARESSSSSAYSGCVRKEERDFRSFARDK